MKRPIVSFLALWLGILLFGCTQPTAQPRAWPLTPPGALGGERGWERSNTAFYQVWVSAFGKGAGPSLATGNTGDLPGITAALRAGYFTDLGINGLWLSPIFKATSLNSGSGNKHGYDTEDYNSIAAIYGDLGDLADLLAEAHSRGIRVIFDFVPNHTSRNHPWFVDSSSSTGAAYRSWYLWRDARPSGWTGFDSWSDWQGTGPYYYGVFGSGMPDLNFRDPGARAAMRTVARDWLDFGFDGLRIDAVKYLYEGDSDAAWKDRGETHAFFDELRSGLLDAYPEGKSRVMLAENWDGDLSNVLSYVKNGSVAEFNVPLDFIWPDVLGRALNSDSPAAAVARLASHMVDDSMAVSRAGGIFGVFQSNHDNAASRPATLYGGDGKRVYLAAALSILGQGMPIVYYGNEIGMAGQVGNDINMRQSFDWAEEARQAADKDSLLAWHRALLKLRSSNAAWNQPSIAQLAVAEAGILALKVSGSAGASVVLVANLNATAADCAVAVAADSAKGILGSTEGDNLAGATLAEGSLAVKGLPAYGIRAWAMNDQLVPVAFDHDPVRADFQSISLPALFLRGSFNSWGTSAAMTRNGSVYSFTQTLAGGSPYQFKFGNADWSTALGGYEVVYDSSHAAPGTLGSSDDGWEGLNLSFMPSVAGSYTFTVDLASQTWWITAN